MRDSIVFGYSCDKNGETDFIHQLFHTQFSFKSASSLVKMTRVDNDREKPKAIKCRNYRNRNKICSRTINDKQKENKIPTDNLIIIKTI